MSSIKLTNNVLVDSASLKVGIDASNQLATISAQTFGDVGYTATQDCWFIATPTTSNSTCWVAIDGVNVFRQWSSATCYNAFPIFLHKGQLIKRGVESGVTLANINVAYVFGTK